MIRKLFILSLFFSTAFAGEINQTSLSSRLSTLVRNSLTEKIAGAEIKIPSLQKLFSKSPMSDFTEITMIHVLEDRPSGVAVIEVLGVKEGNNDAREVIQTPYEAWRKVPVAVKRIYPNSKLKNEDFKTQEVNVATGLAREYRGVMVAPETNFNALQSKQTILENQYVVSSAIEKQPDVRKGDTVKLELISGDLTLTTQAMAQESASVGDQVRVLTLKSKKEVIGKVKEDHSVEVTL